MISLILAVTLVTRAYNGTFSATSGMMMQECKKVKEIALSEPKKNDWTPDGHGTFSYDSCKGKKATPQEDGKPMPSCLKITHANLDLSQFQPQENDIRDAECLE